MDNYLKILMAYKMQRNAKIKQRRQITCERKRLILKNWLSTISNIIETYLASNEMYLPPRRSLKMHRAPDVGKDLLFKLNDKRFSEDFRISRSNFIYICNALSDDLMPKPNFVLSNHKEGTVEDKVAICLHSLKSCCEYQVTGNIFGFSKSTVHRFVYEVVNSIIKNLTPVHIKFPNAEEAQQISDEFEKITKIPQILGAIDGTHIPVTAPLNGARDFINRKGWTSIVLQAVVDHEYKFLDISCKYPGNVHDATVFRGSELFKRHQELMPESNYSINNVQIPYFIIGDPAYPLLPWVLKDYPGKSLETKKELFNTHLNRGRVKVEHTFGVLKKCWRILSRRSEIDVNFVPRVVAACCTLHNIMKKDLLFDQRSIEDNQTNLNEINNEHNLAAGETVRDLLADKLYEEICFEPI